MMLSALNIVSSVDIPFYENEIKIQLFFKLFFSCVTYYFFVRKTLIAE